jgi:Raf kinase inhibitor-like YbhB/YbcL family protein
MFDLRKRKSVTVSICIALPLCVSIASIGAMAKENDKVKALSVSSTAFGAGKVIPKQYTGDGKDVSPPLKWTAGPKGTTGYAISVEDPDAPKGTWWHWIIANIPSNVTQLNEGASRGKLAIPGSVEGKNDFDKLGYNGPMPPKGQNHHYHFKVVALSSPLKLRWGCTKEQYEAALKGNIIGQGELIGTYTH